MVRVQCSEGAPAYKPASKNWEDERTISLVLGDLMKLACKPVLRGNRAAYGERKLGTVSVSEKAQLSALRIPKYSAPLLSAIGKEGAWSREPNFSCLFGDLVSKEGLSHKSPTERWPIGRLVYSIDEAPNFFCGRLMGQPRSAEPVNGTRAGGLVAERLVDHVLTKILHCFL